MVNNPAQSKPPIESQSAPTPCLATALVNEQQWETRWVVTTEQQWRRILQQIRQDIAAGQITPLAEVLR